MKEIFPGVFREGKKIYTITTDKKSVYGEKLKNFRGKEYREWVPSRSKLSAAISNNLRTFPLKKGNKVLYLGASTGTTVSHISDIIESDGIIYAIEFSERMFRSLKDLANRRDNIAPLLLDARKTEKYLWVEECDVVFCDIADPQEVDIFIRNCNNFLHKNGYGMISIKSQSIDVTKIPKEIYKNEIDKLKSNNFKIIEFKELDPYEKFHGFVVIQKS